MPELPEVEVLVRHLRPLMVGRRVLDVHVSRPKIVVPASARSFSRRLKGLVFEEVSRRAKYLVFTLRGGAGSQPTMMLGHLGMTGRMYLQEVTDPLPKHAAVVIGLGREVFVFEDTRYFGRLSFETGSLEKLGPEPLSPDFTVEDFGRALKRSAQAIKVRLLDQRLVAGVGNIYASEALFRAGIRPTARSRKLRLDQVARLWRAIREVLAEAIACGSTVPLNFEGKGKADGLFYFGRAPGAPDYYEERLQVYDRKGQPCFRCGAAIRRLVQGGRSTYFCPGCQLA